MVPAGTNEPCNETVALIGVLAMVANRNVPKGERPLFMGAANSLFHPRGRGRGSKESEELFLGKHATS